MKNKLLIIGAYTKKPIYGGIRTDCLLIRNSFIYNVFNVMEFDTSQKSNPAPKFFIRALLSINRLIRLFLVTMRNNPSVVIIFFSSGFSAIEKTLIAILYTRFSKKKVIMLPRSGKWSSELYKYPDWLRTFIFQSNIFWLCQGSRTHDAILSCSDSVASRVAIIPPLISLPNSAPIDKSGKVVFVFAGWLEPNKGILNILSAISKLDGDFIFHIVGDGTLRSDVLDYCEQDDRVIFHGFIERPDVLNLLCSSDCAVMSSYSEGFPNFLAESISYGLGVISSDVGDIRGILSDINLYDINDNSALPRLMYKVINDESFLFKLKTYSHSVKSSFGIHNFDSQVKNFLGM